MAEPILGFPASFQQKRLWFLEQLYPDHPTFNVGLAFRVHGALDLNALRQALVLTVQRHEILRTTFVEDKGTPLQIVDPEGHFEMEVKAPPENGECSESLIQGLIEQEAKRVFDLSRDSLFRATVLPINADDHIVIFSLHHIICDRWSMSVLVREVGTLYEQALQGRPPALPELPIQYADYAVWQQQQMQSESILRQLTYWTKALDGLSRTEIHPDRPRPHAQTFSGARQLVDIPPQIADRLRAFSKEEHVTLFVTLLSALYILIHRYSSGTDIAVGTSIAGRNHKETENLVGFFLNTLVLRADCRGNPTFREFVGRVAEVAVSAYENQDLPIERLVQQINPERNQQLGGLFQVLFIWQNTPVSVPVLSNHKLVPIEFETGTAKFDLTFEMFDTSTSICGSIEYNADLFSPLTIERLARCYGMLLESIAADPQVGISSIKIISEEEERALLALSDGGTGNLNCYSCLQGLVEEKAAQTPENAAVEWEGLTLTYNELNTNANRMAHLLRSLGAGPGAVVGVYLHRCLELPTAILGILKSGAACLPLDPSYPSSRLQVMVQDSRAMVVLTKSGMEPPFRDIVATFELDEELDRLAMQPSANPALVNGAEDIAYIIYTSGSTGVPKGVLLPHRGLVNHHLAVAEQYGIHADDRVLQFSSLSFDILLEELFPTWLKGATVVLRPDDLCIGGNAFLRWLEDRHITVMDLPTAFWHNWATELANSGQSPPVCVRVVIVGGERAKTDVLQRWNKSVNGTVRWFNTYGPTEASVVTTVYEAAEIPEDSGVPIPIGRPLCNMQTYVMDVGMALTPMGVVGELYIGGCGLSRGYLNDPTSTAERFVPSPWSATPGGRLYRTGDLVRLLPSGDLEFVGRTDQQIKIRGYRVEVMEIEAVLRSHEGIDDAIVIPRVSAAGDLQLIAYIVPTKSTSVSPVEARRFLNCRLPEYMIPAGYVMLNELPMTPNGKVDREGLPLPDLERAVEGAYVSPATFLEGQLAQIWEDILQVSGIGVHDNFFELGGHSLLATQVVARIRDILHIEVPLRSIFEQPTVRGLAETVDRLATDHIVCRAPEIRPTRREGPLPLSFAQERIWFLSQLNPHDTSYHVPRALRIKGPFRTDIAARAFTELVRRHEILRTSFPSINGKPVQLIHEPIEMHIPVIDLRDFSEKERADVVQRIIIEEGNKPFNLHQGPLLRLKLLLEGDQAVVLILVEHHIIHDGWTQGTLARDLLTLYESYSRNQPSPLPELRIQYADFAVWQRAWLQGEALQTQVGYWKEQLSGAPPLLGLPTDYPRPANPSFRGAQETLRLGHSFYDALNGASRQQNVTLFMYMLSAFNILLYRYSGREDLVVGSGIANRRYTCVEDLLGMVINTVPIRTKCPTSSSFRELLQRVRTTCLEAYTYQDTPLDKIVDELQSERSLGYMPLFQVMFSFMDVPAPELQIPGLSIDFLDSHNRSSKFDVTLTVIPPGEDPGMSEQSHNGELMILFEYSTDLFERATILRMMEHYRTLLESVIANPEQRISEIQLLTKEEEEQLKEWNRTDCEQVPAGCVQEWFEQEVERSAGRTAVEFEGAAVSYEELNRRANQVAHYLQGVGVRSESVVGLYLERSVEMVVAILGVLKAGGAYLPLDPQYPAERVRAMMEDSGTRIVLTQHWLQDKLPNGGNVAVVLCVDDPELFATQSTSNLGSQAEPENLAYVIYTSGSTGKPKGVAVAHHSLATHMFWMRSTFPLTQADRILQKTPFGFDASVWEFYAPLICGATLVMAPPGCHNDAECLIASLTDLQITVVQMVPSLMRMLLDQSGFSGCVSLRHVFCGGESLDRDLVTRFVAQCAAQLCNLYGPTEATIDTAFWVAQGNSDNNLLVPIGKPVFRTHFHVLDAGLRRVPVGIPGELYIGGDSLARGYLNNPGFTAEKFVPNPFSERPGGLLYRTGDLVRYMADGNLEFRGRADSQVKLRGFRIELGEVEAMLNKHPQVRQAAACIRTGSSGMKQLCAYLMVQIPVPEVSDLRIWLKDRLPDYMVPSSFVFLSIFPRLPNGKVDYSLLSMPENNRVANREEYIPPETSLERRLARIWEQTLGLEHVGLHENFFEIGGDSILSIQVAARAAKAGIRFATRDVFRNPTVAELSAVAKMSVASLPEQGEFRGSVMLSPVQRWFFEQNFVDPQYFNQAVLLVTSPDVSAGHLRSGLQAIIGHHDVLRSRFRPDPYGLPVMEIDSGCTIAFENIDLSRIPVPEQASEIARLSARLQASFDLTTAPLLCGAFFNLGSDNPGRLLLIAHHLVIDGLSWRILLEDLHSACEQLLAGDQLRFPEKTHSFGHWTKRLAEYANSSEVLQELDYWRDHSRTPTVPLKRDAPGSNSVDSVAYFTASLDVESTKQLLTRAVTGYRAHIPELLLCSLAESLATWHAGQSIIVDVEGHGRDFEDSLDVSRTIGWFTAVYPVVLKIPSEGDPVQTLKSIKRSVRGIAKGGIGYGCLRYMRQELDIQDSLRRLPVSGVLFNYLGQFNTGSNSTLLGLADEPIAPTHSARAMRAYVLELNGKVQSGELSFTWTYSRNIHQASTIQRMASSFFSTLRRLIDESEHLPLQHIIEGSEFGWTDQDVLDIAAKLGDSVTKRGVA